VIRYAAPMNIGERIRRLRLNKNWTQTRLAKEVRERGGSLSQPQLSAIESSDDIRPGSLPELAAALETTVEHLVGSPGGTPPPVERRSDHMPVMNDPQNLHPRMGAIDAPPLPPQRSEMKRDVPVLGVSYGGPGGEFSMNGEAIDHVLRPTRFENRKDLFALYVQGSSMEPRYFAGDLIYLEANRPARVGDFVVVEMMPDGPHPEKPAFVKQFAGEAGGKLKLRQFNPSKDFDIPRDKVFKIYRVMTTADLLG
jgi:phage repressor protein C with HTH and peptisase S24 domain